MCGSLWGLKFTIEYKAGAANKVADALSRQCEDSRSDVPCIFELYTRPMPAVLEVIRAENSSLPDMVQLHESLAAGKGPKHVSAVDGLLYFKRRLFVSRESAACRAILEECHDAPAAGHPGERRTFAHVASLFYWQGLSRDVRNYVAACFTCQATKYVRDKPNGLIQPLPIPDMVWEAASIDFIVGLPPSFGYTAIMVVVDRLSKYAHFGALKSGFDAPMVARLFVDTVVKLHGFPKKLLSDRDSIFMSDFWDDLLSLSGTKLQFTTAYHPQTDGQSEVTNRALEQYLRAFVYDRPKRWFVLMPWVELALNCSVNSSIWMSPFQALYGREPPSLFDTYARPSHNTEVAELLTEREETLRALKLRIQRAQQSMAEFANRKRRDVEFKVGEFVAGEFVEKRRDFACISLLKEFVPNKADGVALPPEFNRSQPRDTPLEATLKRTVLVGKVPQVQWLVRWSSDANAAPSWEPEELLRSHFPHLRLEDKAVAKGGGVDTTLINDATLNDETELHEPMQLDTSRMGKEMESGLRGRPKSRGTKIDRPKRNVSRPAKYRDYVKH